MNEGELLITLLNRIRPLGLRKVNHPMRESNASSPVKKQDLSIRRIGD